MASRTDVLFPRELILPIPAVASNPAKAGALFLSGANLYFVDADGTLRKLSGATLS